MGKPSYCGLVGKMVREAFRGGSLAYNIGLFFLVSNFFVGYGGAALFGVISMKTGDKRWLAGAPVVYGLSWVMLLLAPVLMGKEAKNRLVGRFSRHRKAFKRLRETYRSRLS